MELKDLLKDELIGLRVSVTDSVNEHNVGLSGVVVDETRNALVIEKKNGLQRMVMKAECTFLFSLLGGEKISVKGDLLAGRPEDRMKKKFKTW